MCSLVCVSKFSTKTEGKSGNRAAVTPNGNMPRFKTNVPEPQHPTTVLRVCPPSTRQGKQGRGKPWGWELVSAMMGRREREGATRWYVSLRVICACLAVLLVLASVESMTMEVDNGEQECVIIHASKGSTINANYEV